MIIDSPGIGETKEMTNMVLNYILNASAFIYIIDSTNAGGMQARVNTCIFCFNLFRAGELFLSL